MNLLGSRKVPFLFILDYSLKSPIVTPLTDVDPDIYYTLPIAKKSPEARISNGEVYFEKEPIDFSFYAKAFEYVVTQQKSGNSYLVNLTFPSKITTNLSFSDIYLKSQAPYKLLYKDQFVVFSPEMFVKIRDGQIASYPMKGTIEADLPGAADMILNDYKEAAEHATIVDLIRNDLSSIASKVQVTKYRYLDLISSYQKKLLQVSSEITGQLPADYPAMIGDILYSLLPAGSITGAPKVKTMDIIREAEIDHRGYYTGVFGVFDGMNLDSAVMIRFIENQNGQLFYRSGGGITANSNLAAEYQELVDKIYLPFAKENGFVHLS